MKKKIMMLLTVGITLFAPTRSFAAGGSCRQVIDSKTTIDYSWDCCSSFVTVTVKINDETVKVYGVSASSVDCYKDCCPM